VSLVDGFVFFGAEGHEFGGDFVAGAHFEGAGDNERDAGEGAGGALEFLGFGVVGVELFEVGRVVVVVEVRQEAFGHDRADASTWSRSSRVAWASFWMSPKWAARSAGGLLADVADAEGRR